PRSPRAPRRRRAPPGHVSLAPEPTNASELQACLRDLVALLTLPGTCHGRPPREVVERLVDAVGRVAAPRLVLGVVRDGPRRFESFLCPRGLARAPAREAL